MEPSVELRRGGQTFTLTRALSQRDANCVRGFDDALSILHGVRGTPDVGRLRAFLARHGRTVASPSESNDEGVFRMAARAVSAGELILRPVYASLTEDEREEVNRQLASGKDVPEIARSILVQRGANPSRLHAKVPLRVPFHAAWVTWVPEASPLLQPIKEQQSRFLRDVRTEFSKFPPYVQNAFSATAPFNGVHKGKGSATGVAIPRHTTPRFSDAEASYLVIRTLLWKAGYTDPAALYGKERIASPQEAKLMGVEVQHGVDRRLLGPLAKASAALEQINKQHPGRLPIKLTVIGLQPRRVAKTQTLSNHAFGDSIDIDPSFNPLMDRRASKVIQSRAGIDFSALARSGKSPEVLYQELKAASDRFAEWIKQARASEPRLREIRNGPELAMMSGVYDTSILMDLDILDAEINSGNLTGATAYLRAGFLMVPWEVVKALLDQQFTWGGFWEHNRRDFMHFDFPIPPPPGPQRPRATQ